MVQLIVGNEGKGKSKELINKANEEILKASGNIVFLDRSTKHMFELNNKVRLIDISEYDLIYIGMDTALMNTDNNIDDSWNKMHTKDKVTIYNDEDLYGMVYGHLGDKLHYQFGKDFLTDYKIPCYPTFLFIKEQKEVDINVIEEDIETPTETKEEEKNTPVKVNYVAVIKIPKINLEKGLCDKGTSCNNVNKNIQILDESNFPDIAKGNFILAGHSGSGNIAYFKNVDKLKQDDEITIIYKGFEYKYKIVNIYDVEKTGSANIIRNKEKNTLTLITCRHNTNKQIIVISELVERNEFNG